MDNRLEQDLYGPVKSFFEAKGFAVKAEVKDCDVTAILDELLIIIEMKTVLNLDVILQAAIRQRMTDVVYIAVPKKHRLLNTKRWKNISYLLRRLELGLLLVDFKQETAFVEEAIAPKQFNQEKSKRRSKRRRQEVLNEFNERSGDYNLGGSTRTKLVTAYREKAIQIAVFLDEHKELSIKELKSYGSDPKKTAAIVQDNHYRWFERVRRGVYTLSQSGAKDLTDYQELVDYYKQYKCTNN